MATLPKKESHTNAEHKWKPKMMIKFVLLRSPLAVRQDSEAVVFRSRHRFMSVVILDDLIHSPEILSVTPSLPEILWNFSRHKGRTRITLEQNPHFYSSLPADESAYTPMFKCHPLGDLSILKPHDTVYVLVDRPGRVFLEAEREERRFGNVWMLNGTLIFQDSSGVLEGEQLVRNTIIGNWRRYDQLLAFSNNECCARVNRSHLRPIITTPSVEPASEMPFDDWTVLSYPSSHFINIHIYPAQTLPGTMDLDLPPPAPTSEEPGYQVFYTSINALNDDILLSIFNYYRLVDKKRWNIRLGWRKLAHVCKRWRHLVYGSAFHLDMSLSCTNGFPVVEMLAHLPPLPLVINYRYATATIDALDDLGMFHALQLRDRVRYVDLHIPHSTLHELLALMDEPFPSLEYVSLSSTGDGDTSLILPQNFLAPNLHHLTLSGVGLPGELTLLSTASLVTLTLTNIQTSGYFLPKHLAMALFQSSPHLEELSIGFSVPLPRPSAEWELFNELEPPVTLPRLSRLRFRGVSAYLESLVAQMRAPLLQLLDITLFNQVSFVLPHLSHFTNATQGLKLPIGKIVFNCDSVVVTSSRSWWGDKTPGFSLCVMCKPFDWQLDSATQICSALMPLLSCVEELTLYIDGQEMPTEWQDGAVDGAAWLELLRPFVGANKLCVYRTIVWELSCALQPDHVGLDPELLPALQVLAWRETGYIENAFASFADARQIANRPVRLSPAQWAPTLESQPQSRPPVPFRTGRSIEMLLTNLQQEIQLLMQKRYLPVWEPHLPVWDLPAQDRYLPVPYVPPVRDEQDPPPSRTARSGWGPVKIQLPPPKHIRCRIRPSHMGAGSAWR